MALTDTHDRLQSNLAGHRLVLGKDTLAVVGIETAFEQAFGEQTLAMNGVGTIAISSQAITFSGATTLYGIPDLQVSVTITEPGGTQQVVLIADLLSNWQYSAGTPVYPPNIDTEPGLVDLPLLSAIVQQTTAEKPRLVFSSYAHQNAAVG